MSSWLENMSTHGIHPATPSDSRTAPSGYSSEMGLEQELKSLCMFVEPLLNYPDQYIIICTANRSLLLFSETIRSVLCPKLQSKADLWQSLGTLSPDAEILTTHILDMLTQTNCSPLNTPVSVFNRLYTVETRFITGINTERNLVLSLLPDTQSAVPLSHPQQPIPSEINPMMMSTSYGAQFAPENALKYTMKLNDYVNNCRNDDIYYHANTRDDEDVNVGWRPPRRGSQMGEFIPTMCQPELMLFMDMVKEQPQDVVSLKVSMDSYYYDPVDPDTIPPTFTVNNTSNTGDTGAQIARKSNTAGSSNNANGDKRCYACGTEKSPEWRRGPEGPKTLCNACGLRYAKQLRAGTA